MIGARRLSTGRGPAVTIFLDGTPVEAYTGETVAGALLAAGVDAFGCTRSGHPRLPLCNMGSCFDCAVTVDGAELIRACLTPVADRMRVERTRAW